ncbi:MAG TPA: GH116 family glycosyl-hydrolase [Sedimentisphaerales bacterium]|nr:GH116 family glycosyl-hydrolase [Sedimentisphaerales bacterium]
MKIAAFFLSTLVVCAGTLAQAKEQKPVKELPYTKAELLDTKARTTYEGDYLNMVAFPMGGIGSGCISLAGTGKLIDWEIFNKPNKGYQPKFTFLSVWAKADGKEPVSKVLEGQWRGRLADPIGPEQTEAPGLPRMRQCRFEGKFPFAKVYLEDKSLPVTAVIEGWSPFIPGNSRESSLPVAILNVTLANPTSKTVDLVLAANVQNRAGKYNQVIREPGFCALYMHDGRQDSNSMVLATPAAVTTWQQNWRGSGSWKNNFMCLQYFVNTFAAQGRFDDIGDAVTEKPDPAKVSETRPADSENSKVGSLGVQMTLGPGEKRTVPFVIGWYFPIIGVPGAWEGPDEVFWKNYYATQWKNGLDVARYTVANLDRLGHDTRLFQEAFFSSTLPGVVLEAISSQLSILRSTTVVRYPDGTLYGWEGCHFKNRQGFGTCNHVWNYQQAIPYLFGDLQRSMLDNFMFNGLRESDGGVIYRMPVGPGAKVRQDDKFTSAADGQLGQVCQVYRDWQICGDQKWFDAIWPKTKKALEYAWVAWDKDRDGLLEGSHHNTLDLDFKTPETMCGSLYQAALLAGERMALHAGDTEAAKEYRRVFESGKKLSDEKLFNGEYYHQMLPAPGAYQLGAGSISEQIHGQLYARMLGLEDIYSRENIHKAAASLFKYNYIDSSYDHINTNRVYSVGNEGGLLIACWPKGGRPERPLLYCDETQIGYEYQAAGNMLYEGYILEGLTVIKSIRDRFDGKKRNPFCEIEWGNHYARSMANYNALLALSGFRYSAVEKLLRLAPKVYENQFCVFFSVDSGWGVLSQQISPNRQTLKVDVKKGNLAVEKINLLTDKSVKKVRVTAPEGIGAKVHKAANESWDVDKMITVQLEKTVTVLPERPLVVEIEF